MLLRDLHRHARAGVEPVEARLRAAPDAEARGEVAVHRAGQGHAAVDEQVAAGAGRPPALR